MKLFEVFRAGNYPQGKFSQEDIENLANNYDPKFSEAPITLDHEQRGPAYGWVEKLVSENGKLKASFRDISSELKDYVQSGKYRKISVEIYRELEGKKPYLKAVSFLGASIPQVKGMEPVEFKEGESDVFTFELEEKQHDGKQEKIDFSCIQDQLKTISDNILKFSENIQDKNFAQDLKDQLNELKDHVSKFQQSSIDKETLQKEIDELKESIKNKEFEQFISSQIAEGRITPANKEAVLKVIRELDSIKKFDSNSNALDDFKTFLSSLPKQVEFDEIATKKKQKTVEEEVLEFANASDESLEVYKQAKELADKEQISFKDALLKIYE